MKSKVICSIAALVWLCGISFVACHGFPGAGGGRDRAAVGAVLIEKARIKAACSEVLVGRVAFDRVRALQRYRAIPIASCPRDFQVAWTDYLSAYAEWNKGDLAGLFEVGLALKLGNLPGAAARLIENPKERAMDAAWQRVLVQSNRYCPGLICP